MHRDVVDVLDQLRVLSQTCHGSAVLTGCSTASRTRSSCCDKLGDTEIVAQDHFVADHEADDVRMTVGDVDRGGELGLVGLPVAIDPGAERDFELMPGGDVGDLARGSSARNSCAPP
jgi:hypothetical protein